MNTDIVVDDVDMEPLEDESQTFAPPPHIAARIYKKGSSTRRKSSATSSRRSSISSRHSHQSVLSAHGGPQSTHIAQHLRRASIIESRKARLADRAAHAEQVRLRAALAKAAPRGTIREDRAIAAQAAREKLLADIAARCEEEVRRAKKVAEEAKERKAAELVKAREEMEEKMADVAKRRLLYQQTIRRPRTASLPRVEEKKVAKIALKQLSGFAAAKIIQRNWRASYAARTLKSFRALSLSVDQIRGMDFEAVGALLSTEGVIATTMQLLRLFGMLDADADDFSKRGSVRVFLSSFLVLAHPKQALSHGGSDSQEQDLLGKARNMLEAFEVAMSIPNGHRVVTLVEKLQFSFHNFTSTFHAWKSQDSAALVDIMVNQFVELDLILQTVKDDRAGGVADDYNEAIRTNQIQLLARLKRFAGPEKALGLVRTAVRRARKQHAKRKQASRVEDVPRAASAMSPAPPEHSSSYVPDVPVKASSSTAAGDQASLLLQGLVESMTPIPSNREVSHEIQVNGIFEVQQRPWTESRKAFSDSLRVSMRQALEQGGDLATSGWIRSLASLIRERLMDLVSQKHPLYERIDGFLDIQLIDQTCRAGLFSYVSFFDTIATMLAQICSPGRDEAVKSFADNRHGDTIDRLFNLIDIIDLMSLDHINYGFRVAASTVLEHGPEHERVHFQRDLAEGVHSLDRTRSWWTASRSSLIDESRVIRPNTPPPSGHGIYVRGLVDMILTNKPLDLESLPETLRLDWARLLDIRATAFKIAATASILLTSKTRLRRNREVRWTADADRLMGLDLCTTDADRIVSIIVSSHLMPETTREGLLNFVGRVLPPAAAASRIATEASGTTRQDPAISMGTASAAASDVFTEQVTIFILKSLREHVHSRLISLASSTAEKVRATTSAAEVLARAGMPEFVAEVGKMVDVLARIQRVDLRTHGEWYDQIATEVAGDITQIATAHRA